MKNFGAKIFNNRYKFNRLFKLAMSDKYSAPQLAKIFNCEKKTILGTLGLHGLKLKNLGKFKKKCFCNENFFKILTPVSVYWLGFITADGCLFTKGGKNKNLSIGLNKSDARHLKNFQQAINSEYKITHIKSNNSVRTSIYSDTIFDSLVNIGITPNKSVSMGRVNIPNNLIVHFIRGVFDGDGCLSGNKITHLQFQILGHKPLLAQIQKVLVNKCNVRKVNLYPASYTNKCPIFRLQYTGSQIFRILDFIYSNSTDETRLDRKYKKYKVMERKFIPFVAQHKNQKRL